MEKHAIAAMLLNHIPSRYKNDGISISVFEELGELKSYSDVLYVCVYYEMSGITFLVAVTIDANPATASYAESLVQRRLINFQVNVNKIYNPKIIQSILSATDAAISEFAAAAP